MPNWCDGNIRVRGTYPKIVKFFQDNLLALRLDEKRVMQDIPVKTVHDSDFFTIIRKPEDDCEDEFWFKDSRRQFMKIDEIELPDWSDDDFQEITICIDGFHAAWSIDSEYFSGVAKSGGVDIRIIGFDKGLEFMEIGEFYRDGTVVVKEERFNDWWWECPRPNLGG